MITFDTVQTIIGDKKIMLYIKTISIKRLKCYDNKSIIQFIHFFKI